MKTKHSLRHWLFIAAFGAAYSALALFVDNSYYQLILTLVLIWAVMGLAWNLLSGYSGLISFGHAAFMGLGAYFVVLAQINWGWSPWLGIPVAGLLGGLAGLIVGVPTFRLRGHYFALAMLAYPLALLYIFEWQGYQEVAVPMMRDAPATFMQFEDGRVYIFIGLAFALAAMILTRWLEQSRFGMSLLAIKQDEEAAEAAGIASLAWKLKAIVLSGAMTAAIGGFYAVVQLVVTPLSVFGVLVSAQALVVAMFGGVGTVWGPVIGAVTLVPLSAYLDAELAEVLPGIQGVVYGVAIVAVILLAPEGVFWKVRDLLLRVRPPAEPRRTAAKSEYSDTPFAVVNDGAAAAVLAGPILEVKGLSKAYGGLRAVNSASLSVKRGEILGIIGPNGAGKTTLFNLLNGFTQPDEGEVRLNGEIVTGKAPNQICRRGVGRTFQIVKPFRRMSISDNVVVGAYVSEAKDAAAQALAANAIAAVGLSADAHLTAGSITNKQLRLMELARALASKPSLLLLDEIFAGLGSSEVEEVMAVIGKLNALGITIVIIEHTMQAMVKLVDRFVVLNHGAVLADGTPAEITANRAVIEAYLGKKWLDDA
jgi:branched-chain amino acid transport system permease protein